MSERESERERAREAAWGGGCPSQRQPPPLFAWAGRRLRPVGLDTAPPPPPAGGAVLLRQKPGGGGVRDGCGHS